jgi:hypothetical protein
VVGITVIPSWLPFVRDFGQKEVELFLFFGQKEVELFLFFGQKEVELFCSEFVPGF